jgi:hypothetical protein
MKSDRWSVFVPLLFIFDSIVMAMMQGFLEFFRSKQPQPVHALPAWPTGFLPGAPRERRAGVAASFSNVPQFYIFCIFRKNAAPGRRFFGLSGEPWQGTC